MKCYNKAGQQVPCGRLNSFRWTKKEGKERKHRVLGSGFTGKIYNHQTNASKKGGPGTELKKLLGWFGIKEAGSCRCKSRAALMDSRGIKWCEENIDTILSWLQQEAKARHLPFVFIGAKQMVKLAIWKSKKTYQSD